MIPSAAVGYASRSADPTLQPRSKTNDEPFEPVSTPAASATPRAVAPSLVTGPLSSANVAELLKLTDTPPADASTPKSKVITREDLAEAVRRSKAYASGDASAAGGVNGLAGRYTQKDVGLIRATTGYNVVTVGGLSTIVDDDGNPPPEGLADQVWQFAGNIELRRGAGATSEITADDIEKMFAFYADQKHAFPDDWQDKAIAFLGGTSDRTRA